MARRDGPKNFLSCKIATSGEHDHKIRRDLPAMPIHDWTRVEAGIFHHFHTLWLGAISNALNGGLLPPDYYAMAKQIVGDMGPDVLALEAANPRAETTNGGFFEGVNAVATVPPRVRFTARSESTPYLLRQKHLVVRHRSGDRVVALIEVVSPGNKGNRGAWEAFLGKAVEALARGFHLLVIDIQQPSPRDPQGVHGSLWAAIEDASYQAPPDKPLTLAAYASDQVVTAYVEPIAVGDPLPAMPLFLEATAYVNVPLDATYQEAWRGVPGRWREVLEPRSLE